MHPMKEFVLRLNKTTLFFLLSKFPKVLKLFLTDPFNVIFDDFGI